MPVRVGDVLALISGLPFSVVVRDKGGPFQLLGAAYLGTVFRTRRKNFYTPMDSKIWDRHDREKKMKWKEDHRVDMLSGNVVEADPEVYLDDLLIC